MLYVYDELSDRAQAGVHLHPKALKFMNFSSSDLAMGRAILDDALKALKSIKKVLPFLCNHFDTNTGMICKKNRQ